MFALTIPKSVMPSRVRPCTPLAPNFASVETRETAPDRPRCRMGPRDSRTLVACGAWTAPHAADHGAASVVLVNGAACDTLRAA